MSISESTLYPVLKRLPVPVFKETYDMPIDGETTRKYYRITSAGKKAAELCCDEWKSPEELIEKF